MSFTLNVKIQLGYAVAEYETVYMKNGKNFIQKRTETKEEPEEKLLIGTLYFTYFTFFNVIINNIFKDYTTFASKIHGMMVAS